MAFYLCLIDIKISRVTISLKEYITCNEPTGERLETRKDVQTLNLQDIKCEEIIRNSEYARLRGDIEVYLPDSLYDCKLQKLGPSFFSKICTRGYALEFLVTVECLKGKFNVLSNKRSQVSVFIALRQVHDPKRIYW